jgi:hypothetical protein
MYGNKISKKLYQSSIKILADKMNTLSNITSILKKTAQIKELVFKLSNVSTASE